MILHTKKNKLLQMFCWIVAILCYICRAACDLRRSVKDFDLGKMEKSFTLW